MKQYLKLILYPSLIYLFLIEEKCLPPIKRNNNIMRYLVSIDKWGMAESKWSVTLLKQRNNVTFTTDKPYLTMQQRNILAREMYSRWCGWHLEWTISLQMRLFSYGRSCLRVTWNGNASGMRVTRPLLEVHLRVLVMLPVICTVYYNRIVTLSNLKLLKLLRKKFKEAIAMDQQKVLTIIGSNKGPSF